MPTKMPRLSPTERRYLEDTLRVRLASPGLERHRVRRGSGAIPFLVAALALSGLLAAFVWLSTRT